MKNNRFCVGLALLLCLASDLVCAQQGPSIGERCTSAAHHVLKHFLPAAATLSYCLLDASGGPVPQDVCLHVPTALQGACESTVAAATLCLGLSIIKAHWHELAPLIGAGSYELRRLCGGSMDYCDLGSRDSKLACFVIEGCENRVKQMLAHGADPNFTGASGLRPLTAAIIRSNPALVTLLISYGSDIGLDDRNDAWTPLMSALASGNAEISVLLAERGAALTPEQLQTVLRKTDLSEQAIAAWGASRQALCQRRECIEQLLEQCRVSKDVSRLILSCSESPAAMFVVKVVQAHMHAD